MNRVSPMDDNKKDKRKIIITIMLYSVGVIIIILPLIFHIGLQKEGENRTDSFTTPVVRSMLDHAPVDVSPTLTPSRTPRPAPTATATATATALPVSERLLHLCTTDEEHVSLSWRGQPLALSDLMARSFSSRYTGRKFRVSDPTLSADVDFCVHGNSIITTRSALSSPNGPDLITFNVAAIEHNIYASHIWLLINASNTTQSDRDKKLATVSIAFPGYTRTFDLKIGYELVDWTDANGGITRPAAANVHRVLPLESRPPNRQRTQLVAVRFDITDHAPVRSVSIEDLSQRLLNNTNLALDVIAMTVVKADPARPTPTSTPTITTATTTSLPLCLDQYREQSQHIRRRRFDEISRSLEWNEDITLARDCYDRDNATLVNAPAISESVPFVLYSTGPVLETEPEQRSQDVDSLIKLDFSNDDNIQRVTRVHLLLAARNLCVRQDLPQHRIARGDRIGRIIVHFAGGYTMPVLPLNAGETIRQSRTPDECGDNTDMLDIGDGRKYEKQGMVVTEAIRIAEAGHRTNLQLDLVTLTIPEALRDKRLTAIEIIDDSTRNRDTSATDFHDPFITLYAVTLEHEQ